MAERPQGFARRMMAQQLASDARADPFSDSRFFSNKPKRISDFSKFGEPALGDITPYQAGATGSLFLPGAGIADYFGKAPDPANPGQLLPGFSDNVQQGNYIDAAMQTGGAAGDVAMAAGALFPPAFPAAAALSTALKAPRAGRLASGIDNAVDATRGDPNQVAGSAMDLAQARYFETGKFEPPTADNPVSIMPPTETEPGIIAFHGSGADFDEFRLEMIGTGEGAQAYGYGLYFTDSEDIAKFYRDTISMGNEVSYKGKPIKDLDDDYAPIEDNIAHMVGQQGTKKDQIRVIDDEISRNMRNLSGIEQSIKDYKANPEVYGLKFQGMELDPDIADGIKDDFKDKLDASIRVKENIDLIEVKPAGKMYKVGLAPKPDELLDYDLPLSQQPKAVQKQIENLVDDLLAGEPEAYSNFDFQALAAIKGDTKSNWMGQKIPPEGYSPTGDDILRDLKKFFESQNRQNELYGRGDRLASELMTQFGIPGIKYRAAGSRATTTADEAAERNYVIFDDKAVKILEKYGIVGPVAITAGVAGAARSGNDNEDGGSILPDAGVM